MPRPSNREMSCLINGDPRFNLAKMRQLLELPELVGYTLEFDGSLTLLLPQTSAPSLYTVRNLLFERAGGGLGLVSLRLHTRVWRPLDCACPQCTASTP